MPCLNEKIDCGTNDGMPCLNEKIDRINAGMACLNDNRNAAFIMPSLFSKRTGKRIKFEMLAVFTTTIN